MTLPDLPPDLDRVLSLVRSEFLQATEKFGPFNSRHEGYAVILEELDELWEAIKSKEASDVAVQVEAIQVAAMAVRFLLDVGGAGDRGSR